MSASESIHRPEARGPKRSLGQNFLRDPAIAHQIVSALGLQGDELVCEIGPGRGALTRPLAQLPHPHLRIIAVEKDRSLAPELASHFADDPRIRVVEADALDWDWRQLCGPRPVVLLGNLPYNVGTAILLRFAQPVSPVRRMVLTLQKEVAERVCATPDSAEYGSLSVLIQRFWKTEFLRVIPPASFTPQPNVDSAVIRLSRRPNSEIGRCDAASLEKILRTGFSQRRKQLRKLLGIEPQAWQALAEEIGFRADARAQALSVTQWQQLAARLATDVPDHNRCDQEEIFDVVDETDRVIASLPRSEVHARSLRHRAVHILLQNDAGEIFLQQRAPWKDINPGVWDSSAAGHMDAGETYEHAAHRELNEELGVRAVLEKIGKLPPCDATGQEFIEVYLGCHNGPFRLAGLEITGGAFFPLAQIAEWAAARPQDFSPVFLMCLPLLQKREFRQHS